MSAENTPERKYKNREWLREQYLDKGKSPRQIAEEYGYGSTTIDTWLKKHDIPKRSHGAAVAKAKKPDAPYADESWLKEHYIEKEKSISQIAEEVGVSRGSIEYWLDKYCIETRPPGWKTAGQNKKTGPWDDAEWLRSQYVDARKSTTDIAKEQGVSPSLVRNRLKQFGIERRSSGIKGKHWLESRSYTDGGWLREQYVEENKPTSEIASECDVSADTIYLWMEKHDIERRDRGALSGEEHPCWRGGGSSKYGKGWNEMKKRRVRRRDGHRCQACATTQSEHEDKYGEKLHVHHLIKARDIDDPEERNAMENLITLCRDCHVEWERISEAGIRPQVDAVTAD